MGVFTKSNDITDIRHMYDAHRLWATGFQKREKLNTVPGGCILASDLLLDLIDDHHHRGTENHALSINDTTSSKASTEDVVEEETLEVATEDMVLSTSNNSNENQANQKLCIGDCIIDKFGQIK
ncbi:hypothetical protein ILUMI_25910 [Ignelater luminosus]|uniref:Uncharacterized protein n=1 Tax=Ignelater luminosus TaxID=2038154 RepID=A0A8K0C7I1_IGNLU|nr:hypothetical protein ILUMI_25910 [Ignelater luminosus]